MGSFAYALERTKLPSTCCCWQVWGRLGSKDGRQGDGTAHRVHLQCYPGGDGYSGWNFRLWLVWNTEGP